MRHIPTVPIVSLSDVVMRRDRRTVLNNISLTINRGDFLAITGPNGGGKTTLLRILLRLLKPTLGSVKYFDSTGNPGATLRIGYLPQKNAIDSHFPISVRQVIASGLMGHLASPGDKAETDRMVEAMIDRVDLRSHSNSPIGEISGGQLQRALLGRALIATPELLVLDEPLSYLDRHFEKRLYEELEMISPHSTVVLVSHEMTRIASMATRHVVVDHSLTECQCQSHGVHYDCVG